MNAFRRRYHWGQEWNDNLKDGKLESGFDHFVTKLFQGFSSLYRSLINNPVRSSMHSRQSQLQQNPFRNMWNRTTSRFVEITASLKFHLRVEFEGSFHKLNWLSKTATGNKLIINCKQMPRFFKHGVSNLRVCFPRRRIISFAFIFARWQTRRWSCKT